MISPWSVGQLSPLWTVIMTRDGGVPMNLTGVTTSQISLLIYNASFAQIGTGAGVVTLIDADPGIITYQLASADVPTTAGQYYIRFKVNFNNMTPDMSDRISWIIQS